MDSQQRRRKIVRERAATKSSEVAAYGSRQICIPMTQQQYDDLWDDAAKVRVLLDGLIAKHGELFPVEINNGYALSGMLPESKKMQIRLRQIRIGSVAYTLRPSFVMPYFTGTIEELRSPLLLLAHGVPYWLISEVFGHNDMFWHRQLERLGRNSIVGTTVRDPERLPEHLVADEHHAHWQGKKGYVATVAAEGWFATSNAFKALFTSIVPILCFLHGFLKVRDRCRKEYDLHERIWNIYHALHIRMFDSRMRAFRKWFEQGTWSASITEMTSKLWKRSRQYREAYKHEGCYRTSNQVDRLMNRMTRLLYAGRGIHGHLRASELRLRGWALLNNFRPFAKRSGTERAFTSPVHRLNQKQYHDDWLQNLMISASMAGVRHT